jgi:ABC-2 type transport system ATP-binding protein
VQAFMHSPELLILDEPTSGLDPFLQQQFVELVDEASANGQTVFMSSHVMSEVQQTCHRVAIIRDGALVTVANVDELRETAQRKIEITFDALVPEASFGAIPGLSDVTLSPAGSGSVLRATLSGSPDALVKAAAQYTVTGLTSAEPELEELFFTFYQREPLSRAERSEASGVEEVSRAERSEASGVEEQS